jgi:hypothetical protein
LCVACSLSARVEQYDREYRTQQEEEERRREEGLRLLKQAEAELRVEQQAAARRKRRASLVTGTGTGGVGGVGAAGGAGRTLSPLEFRRPQTTPAGSSRAPLTSSATSPAMIPKSKSRTFSLRKGGAGGKGGGAVPASTRVAGGGGAAVRGIHNAKAATASAGIATAAEVTSGGEASAVKPPVKTPMKATPRKKKGNPLLFSGSKAGSTRF